MNNIRRTFQVSNIILNISAKINLIKPHLTHINDLYSMFNIFY